MNRNISIVLIVLSVFLLAQCSSKGSKSVKIKFDSTKEVSGQKFAIEDITPGLPANWDEFYRKLPDANSDLASTYIQPRLTGWINLGGKRGPLHGVDSIGIRMHVPIRDPEIEIRSIALSVEDPGDVYLGTEPVIDEFGQWNLGEFEGKIKSMEQLRKEWQAEDNEVVSTDAYNLWWLSSEKG